MEKLVSTTELGEILSTSKRLARQLMETHRFKPIDLGKGRGRGLRWRVSDVENLIRKLSMEPSARRTRYGKTKTVAEMKIDEIFACVNGQSQI